MVRFLLNGGKKIQLLPPPDPHSEEVKCDKCLKDFDTGLNRRACFQLCGHISCLTCIIKLTNGCLQCPTPRERAFLRKLAKTNGIRRRRKENMSKARKELEVHMPQVMVLSSVLTKNGGDDDEDTFPEIERLSLSALPVLGCPTEPPKHLQEEDDEEGEQEFEEEEEVIDDDNQEIPLIELSDDEEIPLIDLSSDGEEDVREEHMFQNSNQNASHPVSLPFLQNVQSVPVIFGPPLVQTPSTQPSSPVTPTFDQIPTDKLPSIIISTSTIGTTTKRPKSTKQVSGKTNNKRGNKRLVVVLASESEENEPPRTLRLRKKSQSYSSDYWDGAGFGKHTCKYCDTGYSDKKTLGLHLLHEHWDIRRFPCTVCDWPFDTQRNLEIHMLTHTNERPFKCSICDRGFNRNYTLGKHMEKLHGVILEKKRRGKNKQRPKASKLGRRRSARKERVTPTERNHQLSESMSDDGSIPEPIPIPVHINLTSSDEEKSNDEFEETSNYQFEEKSNDEFEEASHYQFEEKSNDEFEEKSNDEFVTLTPAPMQMEEQNENTLEPLDEIRENFIIPTQNHSLGLPPKKRLYLRNCRQMAPDPLSSPTQINRAETTTASKVNNKQYTCCHCRMKFTRKMKLGTHLREMHADKRPHSCDLCGWSFAQKNKLNLHRITHTIDRPHKCKQCDSTFNRKYSLERHVRIMHLKRPRNCEAAENKRCQRKSAGCPYCHKIFPSRNSLGIHMICAHGDQRPHICTECQWPFARKKHLVAHKKTHSKEKEWQCAMCNGKYNRRFSLERHMDGVHRIRIRLTPEEENPTQEADYFCPECQSRFDADKYAKVAYSECNHYSCMACVIKAELGCGQCTTEHASSMDLDLEDGASMSQDAPAKVFQRQVQVKEKVFVDKSKISTSPKFPIPQSPNKLNGVNNAGKVEKKRTWKCTYCRRLFNSKRDLGVHMQFLHSDMRPYSCNVCQWAFSSQRDLERHQIIHTNERPYKCQLCSFAFNRKSARDRHVEKIHLKWRRI